MSPAPQVKDVVIVGGGFAGTAAAISLAARGLSVALVDLHDTPRPAFRAEKFSADQLPLLDELGLLELFKPATVVARQAINIRGRHVVDRPAVEDHGLLYADMVKLLRRHVPAGVDVVVGKAEAVATSDDVQTVRLSDGRSVAARLVVLATGHARGLRESLGIVRRVIDPTPTINVAFTLTPPPGGYAFPSLAAYGEATGDGVDYVSIFPVGQAMRVNLFLFGGLSEPRVAAFKTDPMKALHALLPGVAPWLAGCGVADKAEFFVVEMSICDQVLRPGVALIGDAYRTSCPAVGTGLSCVLVDVARLRALAPGWLATPGMAADKIAQFYADPVKQRQDEETHRLALQRRRSIMDSTLSNRLRRAVHFARRRLADRRAP
jgi:2-polyprenyl-6-methoxyphenol hydroxylase-like FAD-dependent oxidoreductase